MPSGYATCRRRVCPCSQRSSAMSFAKSAIVTSWPLPTLRCRFAGIVLSIEHTGIRLSIIHKKEFPTRRACTPHRHGRGAILFRLMEAPDQSRYHMAIIGMVIVAGAVRFVGMADMKSTPYWRR